MYMNSAKVGVVSVCIYYRCGVHFRCGVVGCGLATTNAFKWVWSSNDKCFQKWVWSNKKLTHYT